MMFPTRLAALALLAGVASAPQAAVLVLPNTGNGSQVAGTTDPNWTVKNALGTSQAEVLSPSAANWWGDWVPNDATSSWIGYKASDTRSYPPPLVFTSKFDLTGYIVSTAQISGSWAVDDVGVLLINGNFVDFRPAGAWNALQPFSFAPADLVAGVNTVTIVITDTDDYLEGVRFQATGTADPIPEPETYALLVAGLGLVGWAAQRRRKSA